MNDTGYVIWFIATIVATVSIMALGVAASAHSVRSAQVPARATHERRHLHLVPHLRDHRHDRHHAA